MPMAIPSTARACSTLVPALSSVRFWLYAIWISLLRVGSRKPVHQCSYSSGPDLTERLSAPRNFSASGARGGTKFGPIVHATVGRRSAATSNPRIDQPSKSADIAPPPKRCLMLRLQGFLPHASANSCVSLYCCVARQDGGFSTEGMTYSSHFFIRIVTFEMTCVALPFCV